MADYVMTIESEDEQDPVGPDVLDGAEAQMDDNFVFELPADSYFDEPSGSLNLITNTSSKPVESCSTLILF